MYYSWSLFRAPRDSCDGTAALFTFGVIPGRDSNISWELKSNDGSVSFNSKEQGHSALDSFDEKNVVMDLCLPLEKE